MFSKYLTNIEGVSIFPIIGLLLFFGIFVFLVIKIFTADKVEMDKYSRIPLDADNKNLKNNSEI